MAVVEHRFRVMASEAHIICVDAPGGALIRAEVMLERLEECWSRFLPDSDIARINLAEGNPVVVDPITLTLVATMTEAWRVTDGLYDPTTLPVLMEEGYRSSIDDPSRETILPSATVHLGGLGAVVVDTEARTVQAPPECALDPGGIGKGLAADLVVARLLDTGTSGALVDVGGDLACAGTPPQGGGWVVSVGNPFDPDADMACFALGAGGVATSSTRSRRWIRDGANRHHVIDPTVGGASRTDLAAATVVARSGWLAEAHATAAILAGSDGVVGYLEDHDLSGLAVAADGVVVSTSDLDEALSTNTCTVP